jgi:hypothetical protein
MGRCNSRLETGPGAGNLAPSDKNNQRRQANMNAATVIRVLSLVPERAARAKSGAAFRLEGSVCRYPERLAYMLRFLHWLGPLEALTKDDQRTLGLIATRAGHGADEDEGELDAEETSLPA